jgi:hypothetical protein|tara:strand:- start:469 stop:588 length:120 start_codon:yes stop_codon:yes gene_type:complete
MRGKEERGRRRRAVVYISPSLFGLLPGDWTHLGITGNQY